MNLVTNQLVRVLGKTENTERFLRVALYQGVPRKPRSRVPMADSKVVLHDPTIIACSFGKQRMFLFTRREPEDATDALTGRWAQDKFVV